MSVMKPRNRLINFRLTEEEFGTLHDACRSQGARSISDFARAAVLQQAVTGEGAGPARVDVLLGRIDTRLESLDTRLTGWMAEKGPAA